MKTAKIVLKELVFFARHGLLEEDAKLGQRFRLDVVVEAVEHPPAEEAALAATLFAGDGLALADEAPPLAFAAGEA